MEEKIRDVINENLNLKSINETIKQELICVKKNNRILLQNLQKII